ncbi:MATE family efflux transporter [Aquimarina rhabdastrellae]
METSKDLGKEDVKSLFFAYYKPILMSLLSITIHQIVDGIILGQKVGKEGIAAIGIYAPVLIVFIAFCLAVMIGGGIMVSKNIGAKDYSKVQHVFEFTTTIAILIGIVVSSIAIFFTEEIAMMLAGNENMALYENTEVYMFWSFIGLPFFLVRIVWGGLLNNDNAPKIARNASILAAGVNIILDILLVIVFPFGMAGASIATAIAIFSAVLYVFVYIYSGKSSFSVKNFKFRVQYEEWKELLAYGFPSCISELCFALGFLVINKYLLDYGALAVAAFGLINYISFSFLRLFTAAMLAMQPIISFNIGAKQPERVLAILKYTLQFTIVLGAIVFGIGYFFPDILIRIFSNDKTITFNELARTSLMIYFALFFVAGPNYVLVMYLQSIGKSKLATFFNIMKGLGFVILYINILPAINNWGLNGIWWVRPITEISVLILIVIYTRSQYIKYYSKEAILNKL